MPHILIWGDLKLCLGRISSPKPPRGDGTGCDLPIKHIQPGGVNLELRFLSRLPGKCGSNVVGQWQVAESLCSS